jgi:putative zinc finger/helix-turn-helix YgiT family protein
MATEVVHGVRRCVECGLEQTCVRKETPYPESGLRNVQLFNVPVWICPNGHEEIQIPAQRQLHELLATLILRKSAPLDGAEVRFLRKRLGLGSKEFSKRIGISPVHISRIENGERRIPRPLNLLIRLFFASALSARDGKTYPEMGHILDQLEHVIMDLGSHRLRHVAADESSANMEEWREAS